MNQLDKTTLRFVVRQLIKDIKIAQQDLKDAFTQEDANSYESKANALIAQKIKFEGLIKHAK